MTSCVLVMRAVGWADRGALTRHSCRGAEAPLYPCYLFRNMIRRVLALLLVATTLSPSAFAKDKFQQPGPVHLDKDGEKWVEKTLKSMSLEDKVGQMFMIWAKASFVNVQSPEYLKL